MKFYDGLVLAKTGEVELKQHKHPTIEPGCLNEDLFLINCICNIKVDTPQPVNKEYQVHTKRMIVLPNFLPKSC